MKYVLDTNICILLFDGAFPNLRARVEACARGALAISTISLAELTLGSRLGKAPPPPELEALVRQLAVLPFDAAAARAYSTLPFKRGSFDRLIGAHVLALDLTLVTNNEADFADLPGLRVENWART